jgi:HK97 family phage major capsid protein
MSTLVAKRRELETLEGQMQAKRKENAVIFQEAGPELNMDNVKSISGNSSDKVKHIQNINAELADMGQKRDALAAEVKTLAEFEANMKASEGFDQFKQAEGDARGKTRMGLGKSFIESAAYKGRKNEQSATLDVDLKALFQTTAGWTPETTRVGVVVPGATRPLQIIDVIPQMPTGQAAVKYMVETFANAAAEVAEGGTYAEATLSYAEASQVVQKVAVYLPVTDEQMEDATEAEAYVEQRLPFMVQQRLDSQLLVGNGTAPNLRGILNVVGVQTQAKASDPTPDAVYKAIVKVQAVGFANPDVFITHPNDWQDIRLLKTADGIYIWGSPSEAGPQRIWGLNVVVATAITENTGLVGDFAAFSAFYLRKGVEVQYGFINDDFIKGRKALRADLRGAMVVYRPAAFCTVTGI